MKLKRGQKRCKSCKHINAARQRNCSNCNKEFINKNRIIKNEIKDWKSLQPGEAFRVVKGTGPYYILDRDCGEGGAGDRLFMGAKGQYIVKEITSTGIDAWGVSKFGSCRYEFVYMGKSSYCEKLNIHRQAHRIVKINIKR
tara:strand:+ start:177 stop:599 length:423 start_codon:yes stop_codon:yes gene_type:complete